MIFRKILQTAKNFASHPLGRGMMAYSITFPTSCFIQEYYVKRNLDTINWLKCSQYSLYGTFVSAPMLYNWVNILTKVWPKRSLSVALQTAIIEQIVFAPTVITLFFFTMGLLDNNFNVDIAKSELKRKFWNSYKVGLCYWPIVQVINLTFVPRRNRVVFVSMCGLVWVTFLAYIDTQGSVKFAKIDNIDIQNSNTLKTQA